MLFLLTLLPFSLCAAQTDSAGPQAARGDPADSRATAESGRTDQGQPAAAGQSQQPPAAGQPQGTTGTTEPSKQQQEQQKEQEKKKQEKGEKEHERVLFLVPNFSTVNKTGPVEPLTPAQKFKLVARGTFDPFQFVYYAALAGISQASNDESGYGQGAQGYGKRYAAVFGDSTIENFMVGAALPSLLHQDPRYFRMRTGGFKRRWWYALSRVFVTRSDSGKSQFNASEIFGSAISAAISTYSYHPEADQKILNVGGTWAAQLGSDLYGFTMKEFWPDIRRHLRRKHPAPGGNATSGSE